MARKPCASWRTFFSTHHKLGLSGKVTGPQERRKTRHLGRCVPSSVSGAQEPNSLENSEGRNVCENGKLSLWKHLLFLKRFYLFIFREQGREGERERNINVWLPLARPPLGTTTQAWESDRWPFGWQAGAQPTEPHQPGLKTLLETILAWLGSSVA